MAVQESCLPAVGKYEARRRGGGGGITKPDLAAALCLSRKSANAK